jgi:hypothetical protein
LYPNFSADVCFSFPSSFLQIIPVHHGTALSFFKPAQAGAKAEFSTFVKSKLRAERIAKGASHN